MNQQIATALLFLLLVVVNVANAQELTDDYLKSACQAQERETGVFCLEGDKAVVFCHQTKTLGHQLCEFGCRQHDFVPDTCDTESKTFHFRLAKGQRSDTWAREPPNLKHDDENFAKGFLNVADKTVYIESTTLLPGDDTDDLIIYDMDKAPDFPRGSNIHGIKVRLLMKTLQNTGVFLLADGTYGANVTEDGNSFCYLENLELRTADVTSGPRGSDYGASRRPIPDSWEVNERGAHNWRLQATAQGMVFGGRLDTWDTVTDPDDIKHDLMIELNAKFGVFNNTKVNGVPSGEYIGRHHSTNNGTCMVGAASMEVFYSVPNDGTAVPEHLVYGGSSSLGTEWRHYTKNDGDGHAVKHEPKEDKNGNRWMDINYKFDEEDWGVGKGVFGYGSKQIETTAVHGHRNTAYFRTSFTLDVDPDCLGDIHLKHLVDDGAIFYLNGQPFYWTGMDPEFVQRNITYETYALSRVADENAQKSAVVPDHVLLLRGINVLAVEVHQVNSESSDLHFDLTAWVYNSCKKAVPHPMDADSDDVDPKASPKKTTGGLSTLLIVGVIFGLFMALAYFGWRRMAKRQRRANAVTRNVVQFESGTASESVPLEEPTERYVQRPTAGTASIAARRVALQSEDWDDF